MVVRQSLGIAEAERQRRWSPTAFRGSGAFWLALAAIGVLALYWPGLAWVVTAWERPEYSHGYLIPPIALYLFLDQLRREDAATKAETPAGRRLGPAVVALGIAVGLLGNFIQAPGIVVYALVIAIAGLVLTAMGTARGLRFWAPVFYLVFMLPLPTSVYWQLSIRLQLISSELGVALISLLGVPVFLDGNVIDLGTYQLQVAEACSGLRYLFPLASFGFLFAVLYRGPFWHRAVLFLSTLPITVLMNTFRIAVIGFLVDRFGIAQAEGFLHAFEGWIIFIACIVILYGEAIVLQRFAPSRQPIHRMLDVDIRGLGSELRKLGTLPSSTALIVAALAIVLAAAAWHLAPQRTATAPARSPLVLFPDTLGEWHGRQALLDPDIVNVLEADDYLQANYASTGGATVNLFVAYYRSLTQGNGIHSPEVCIPAGGWEVSGWATVNTGMRTASGVPLQVNRAIIQNGLSRQLVYYWFEERGRALTNDYVAKAYTVWDSLARGRMDGALVRVITPIDIAGSVDAADTRLRTFLTLALPELPKFVPN